MNSWFVIPAEARGAAENMAFDQALLEAMPRLARPVLRFYRWSEPAASFGYFQNYSAISRATLLRPLVRRPTGGGMVPHDCDWTYSLAFPIEHEWYALRATESYRRVHEWIQAAFAQLNIQTELAAHGRQAGAGQCFVGHEPSDVLWRGNKIAGAAQRRTRNGLLIQGSLQPPPLSLARTDWEKAMCRWGARVNGNDWSQLTPDHSFRERVEELAREKYSQPAYNQKR